MSKKGFDMPSKKLGEDSVGGFGLGGWGGGIGT